MAVGVRTKSKKARRDRDATRAAFIAAGEKLFAAHGFGGATLDMLAADAGANKALVSYYFGSKEGLYDAVIEALVGDVVGAVSGAIVDGADPVKNFRNYIQALARGFAVRPTFPAILMREYIGGSMQERLEPFRQVLQFYRMTETLYKDGRKKGVFRKLDAHQLHLSIIGPLVHFTLTSRFRDRTFSRLAGDVENPPMTAFANHLAGLVLNGMRRKDGSAR